MLVSCVADIERQGMLIFFHTKCLRYKIY
jgi:hypothetical protein